MFINVYCLIYFVELSRLSHVYRSLKTNISSYIINNIFKLSTITASIENSWLAKMRLQSINEEYTRGNSLSIQYNVYIRLDYDWMKNRTFFMLIQVNSSCFLWWNLLIFGEKPFGQENTVLLCTLVNLKENTFINKDNFEPSWYIYTYEDKNTCIYTPVNFLILFLVAEKHTLVPEQ